MANQKHLKILERGLDVWDRWRENNPHIRPDLFGAKLIGKSLTRAHQSAPAGLINISAKGINLSNANLMGAQLNDADLIKADLRNATLSGAVLVGANLTLGKLNKAKLEAADLTHASFRDANLENARLIGANLYAANFTGANLTGADLSGTELIRTNLREAQLTETNFKNAVFLETMLANTSFKKPRNLRHSVHWGPSVIDHRTIIKSGRLPLTFLSRCGLPDNLIDFFLNQISSRFYSSFISWSSKDSKFVDKLYASLRSKGVACFLANKNMKVGVKIRQALDDYIMKTDKVIVIISKSSIRSQWVEQEVEKALQRERNEGREDILLPIAIDDVFLRIETGWPAFLKNTRNIGDFRRWKSRPLYNEKLRQLLGSLEL